MFRQPHYTFITSEPLDIQGLSKRVEADAFGAGVVFLGWVRNSHAGRAVSGLTYDCFQPLAEKILEEIVSGASQRLGALGTVAVAHRIGELKVGECSLVIAVGSAHRDLAYEVSRFILEEIKARLPVWKEEHYTDGEVSWLPGQSLKRLERLAIVLTGGRSTRMGTNKATLKRGGESLFKHIAQVCATVVGSDSQVVVSGAVAETHSAREFADLPDFKERGPLGGLLSVLHSLSERPATVLVVPVDLPLLEAFVLERLLLEAEKESRTTGVYYENSVLPCAFALRDATLLSRAKDLHSIKELHQLLKSRALPADEKILKCLTNVNTPEEWAQVEPKL